jgi:hypothetical protein
MNRREALQAGLMVFFSPGLAGLGEPSVYRASDSHPANLRRRWWWRYSPTARKWSECEFETIRTGDLLQYQDHNSMDRAVVVASGDYEDHPEHGPSIAGEIVGYAYQPHMLSA